jgi:hypothetical protein
MAKRRSALQRPQYLGVSAVMRYQSTQIAIAQEPSGQYPTAAWPKAPIFRNLLSRYAFCSTHASIRATSSKTGKASISAAEKPSSIRAS